MTPFSERQLLDHPPERLGAVSGADVRMAEDEFERLLLGRVSQQNLVVIEEPGPNGEPAD